MLLLINGCRLNRTIEITVVLTVLKYFDIWIINIRVFMRDPQSSNAGNVLKKA